MSVLDSVELYLVESVAEASDFMSWLGQRRDLLVIDTETGGLQPWKDKLRLVQFGDEKTGWAIPWDRWGGVAVEALTKYEGELGFHHAKFDVTFLEEQAGVKIPWHRVHDSMTMAHIDDALLSVGLKPLSARLVDNRAAGMQQTLDAGMAANKWTWGTVPIEFAPYWQYAALDPVLTAHCHRILRPRMVGRYADVYDLEMAVQRCIMGMQRRGARIDLPFVAEKGAAILKYVEETEAFVKHTWGVSPGSNQAVVSRLQQDGVDFMKQTPSGAWSLDKEVLEAIDHPLAEMVLMRRRAQKIHSTYFRNFGEMHWEGFLRPSINPLGARTARMSVSEPALQTLPRDAQENPFAILVRDCFIPRDGHRLMMADFDQIEQRMLAHLCEDPGMIAAFTEEGDYFTNIARELYADESLVKKDPRRQMTKNGMYAIAYGAGAAKIAITTKRPLPEVEEFLGRLHARFPGIRTFQQMVQNVAMQRRYEEGEAYVHTLLGRKQVADEGKEYALVNYLIQGTAADVLKQKIVELDALGLGEYMILPVHDEIVFDVPADLVDDARHLVLNSMAEREMFKVPLTVGVEVHDRWGDKYRSN